jgi:hypothetical protein
MSELLPPPLAWLESFRASVSRALGDELTLSVVVSVNPLVYLVYLGGCPSTTPGELKLSVWNLLQRWAVKNDCPLQGKDIMSEDGWRFEVIVKRRFGPARDTNPMG